MAFTGDVLVGNHIEIVQVPTTAFEVVPDYNVPTTARLQVLLAPQPNAVHFGPFEDDTPDTQIIVVCKMVPIPPAYVHLILD